MIKLIGSVESLSTSVSYYQISVKPDEKMTAKNIERLVKSWENDLNQAKKELPNIYNLLRVLDQQLR